MVRVEVVVERDLSAPRPSTPLAAAPFTCGSPDLFCRPCPFALHPFNSVESSTRPALRTAPGRSPPKPPSQNCVSPYCVSGYEVGTNKRAECARLCGCGLGSGPQTTNPGRVGAPNNKPGAGRGPKQQTRGGSGPQTTNPGRVGAPNNKPGAGRGPKQQTWGGP
jgi:hypothetical protein